MTVYQIQFQVKWFLFSVFIQIEERSNKLSVDEAAKIILVINYYGI